MRGSTSICGCRQARQPADRLDGTLLLIDADVDHRTGWLGYDLIVHRSPLADDGGRVVVAENVAGRYEWKTREPVACRWGKRELELAVSRAVLLTSPRPTALEFKWADQIQRTGSWEDFTLHGDVAPNDRFNYRAVFPEGKHR